MSHETVRVESNSGFSLPELTLVLALGTITSVMALIGFNTVSAIVQGDAELRAIEATLKRAREMAINERREMEVRFVPPNAVQIVRLNLPNGTTDVQTTILEHRAIFLKFAGMPDTPDAFGNGTPVTFSSPGAVMFTPDGRFTDAVGNTVNGTILIGQLKRPLSARALTIFGPTATVRTYRWNGTQWRR